jgi:hypothetical protein
MEGKWESGGTASPKAVLKPPHSKRFALTVTLGLRASVWSAVALAPLFSVSRTAKNPEA